MAFANISAVVFSRCVAEGKSIVVLVLGFPSSLPLLLTPSLT